LFFFISGHEQTLQRLTRSVCYCSCCVLHRSLCSRCCL